MRSARGQLVVVCLIQVLALSVWFSASAVAPNLKVEWGISDWQASLLTVSVQIGFVCGALASAVLNLADVVHPSRLIAVSCLVAAGLNLAMSLWSDGLVSAIALRMGIGVALAGVYPVGMRVVAAWFPRRSALALALMIAALTLGSMLPNLLRGAATLDWRPVLWGSSALALEAVLLSLLLLSLPGGANVSSKINTGFVKELVRERTVRSINLGYIGHMWELYALWTWFPTFILSLQAISGPWAREGQVFLGSFLVLGVGGTVGCLVGGLVGTHRGSIVAAKLALAISGTCCLVVPLAGDGLVLAGLSFVWGAAVIADSAQFSSALSDNVPPHYAGTALTFQTALGFLVTVVAIQVLPLIAGLAGWQGAMMTLALGPAAGLLALTRVASHRPT